VHPRGSRPRVVAGHTCRHLRSPCRSENTCWKSFPTRFLLVHGSRRLEGHREAL
jgi:hypothetical protein